MTFIDALTKLKDFLSDRPEWAFLAVSMVCNLYLFRKYDKARDAHVNTILHWLPAVERLIEVVDYAATKARIGSPGVSE